LPSEERGLESPRGRGVAGLQLERAIGDSSCLPRGSSVESWRSAAGRQAASRGRRASVPGEDSWFRALRAGGRQGREVARSQARASGEGLEPGTGRGSSAQGGRERGREPELSEALADRVAVEDRGEGASDPAAAVADEHVDAEDALEQLRPGIGSTWSRDELR